MAVLESYPAPQERMLQALKFLRERDVMGATWFELGDHYGWHHGQSSSVLSTMHREGRISRLTVKRGRSFVYVDNLHVNGRETGKHGRKVNDDNAYFDGFMEGMEEVRAIAVMIRAGTNKPLAIHNNTCWQNHATCALDVVLRQIDLKKGKRAA